MNLNDKFMYLLFQTTQHRCVIIIYCLEVKLTFLEKLRALHPSVTYTKDTKADSTLYSIYLTLRKIAI